MPSHRGRRVCITEKQKGEDGVTRSVKLQAANRIEKHEFILKQLVGEINEFHAKAFKAQQAAVHHALEVGRKLNLAHKLLARLRTGRRKKGLEPPPTWEEWVKENLNFSVRTSYYYRELDKHHKEVKPELTKPDASIRKLVRFLGSHVGDEDDDEKGAGEKGGADKPTEHEWALQEIRERFREAVKGWPEAVVVYLADYTEDFDSLLDAIRHKVRRLARSWLKGHRREQKAREQEDADPAGTDNLVLETRTAFRQGLWEKVKDRHDLNAYEKYKLADLLSGEDWLTPRDRRQLADLTGDEAVAEPKLANPPPKPRNEQERRAQSKARAWGLVQEAERQQKRLEEACRA